MTTLSVPRQPFGVLDSPRLAHLSSSKNRQIGAITTPGPLSEKAKMAGSPTLHLSSKRRLAASVYDESQHDNAENVNPDGFLSPAKRSKTDSSITTLKSKASSFASPSSFSFTFNAPKSSVSSMPPPSAVPARLHTPLRCTSSKKTSSPRTPRTAPAGRSPKQKRDRRRLSAHTPFTRVDPPTFSLSSSDCTGLPFSLDAALNGSLPSSMNSSSPSSLPLASIEDTMPKSWFFSIHEDTPEEEAENLMEHSTLTLDLGSDDENAPKASDDRGKENVAPDDYVTSSSASPRRSRLEKKSAIDMDTDSAPRSPLSDLDTTEFFPEGLCKDSIIFVPISPEKSGSYVAEAGDIGYAAPVAVSRSGEMAVIDVVSQQGDLKGEIVIWEDESANNAASAGEKRKRDIRNEGES